MKRHFLLYTALIFLLSIQAQQIRQKYNIVFIGNSITYGAKLSSPKTESPPTEVVRILKEKGYDVMYANCGYSGKTTVDFLPASGKYFHKVIQVTDTLYKPDAQLIFSIMLGTNDSAIKGPNGSPVSPTDYRKNLLTIIDSLRARYPNSHFILHRPIWYSTNTYNSSMYLEEGLKRLQTYTKELDYLIKHNPTYIFKGDRNAYNFFKKQPEKHFTAEKGNSGTFFLHPNASGAKRLGSFWADNLLKYIDKLKEK